MAVFNPIHPGFEWRQAFDLPAGFVQPGDRFRSEFRETVRDRSELATVETGSGVALEGDRLFVTLSEAQTGKMASGTVVTGFVLIRGDDEIPLGQIVRVPVALYPTRATP